MALAGDIRFDGGIMREQTILKVVRFLIKYIGLLIPVGIGLVIYNYFDESLFLVVSFYFLLLSRTQLELFEKLNELDEKKAEESQIWKNLLNKRKSF